MTDKTRATIRSAINRALYDNNLQLTDPVHRDIHPELEEDNDNLTQALKEIEDAQNQS